MAKSKWNSIKDKLILVEGWARDGLIEKQIAKNLGISVSTLELYKNKYSEFSEALKKGKEVVDREVENALLKRALGYSYTEVTKELLITTDEHDKPIRNEKGAVIKELKVTKEVTKEVQPDTTAQIFWLKNRCKDRWRDKQDINLGGQQGNPIDVEVQNKELDLSHLSVEELKELLTSAD